MLPKEVFLSHSSADKEFADLLAETLRKHGIPVWYSQTNILGAQQWHDEIGEALKRCDWFIVILTGNSVQSMWVKREIMFALNDNRFSNKIIPILCQSCDYDNLSWTLSLFQIIDFRQNSDDGFRELFRTWGFGYKK